MGKTAPWVIGTAFGVLVIAAFAWLFGVSPRLEAAAEMREEAESEQSRIDTLEIELASLRKDFDNIETFRADLAALRVQVPTDELVPDVIRQLTAHAFGAGVVITNAISETPTAITIMREEAIVPPEPVEGQEAAPVDPNAPTTQIIATQSEFLVVPMRIRTMGGFAETLRFLELVQTQSPRLILDSDLSMASLEEKSAEGGLPAVFDGWLDTEHTLYLIVLPDAEAVPAVPGPLPVPGPDAANPFTKLTVSGDILSGVVGPATPPTTPEPDPEATEGETTDGETTEGDGEPAPEG